MDVYCGFIFQVALPLSLVVRRLRSCTALPTFKNGIRPTFSNLDLKRTFDTFSKIIITFEMRRDRTVILEVYMISRNDGRAVLLELTAAFGPKCTLRHVITLLKKLIAGICILMDFFFD